MNLNCADAIHAVADFLGFFNRPRKCGHGFSPGLCRSCYLDEVLVDGEYETLDDDPFVPRDVDDD